MTGATPELHMKKKIAYLNENALKVVLRNDEKQTIFCSICFKWANPMPHFVALITASSPCFSPFLDFHTGSIPRDWATTSMLYCRSAKFTVAAGPRRALTKPAAAFSCFFFSFFKSPVTSDSSATIWSLKPESWSLSVSLALVASTTESSTSTIVSISVIMCENNTTRRPESSLAPPHLRCSPPRLSVLLQPMSASSSQSSCRGNPMTKYKTDPIYVCFCVCFFRI